MGKLTERLPGLFDDAEVATAGHDKIMLWLDAQCRRPGWIEAQLFWPEDERKEAMLTMANVAEVWASAGLPRKYKLPIDLLNSVKEQVELFRMACVRRKDVPDFIGHAEAMKRLPDALTDHHDGIEVEVWGDAPHPSWEVPIMNRQRLPPVPVGYLDMHVRSGMRYRPANLIFNYVAFEVKSTWPSYGQLIRQINGYRAYDGQNPRETCYGWFAVVAPPNPQGEKLLREQGIRFIPYDAGMP